MRTMRRRSALIIAGLGITCTVLAGTPATAAPLDKGHFDDTFTETFDCDSVAPPVPTRHDSTAHINFTFNQRGGPNVFPYYRESVSGTNVYTNLDTGGTYTEMFTSNNRDHKIVDNGDDTITIFSQGSGTQRWYDTNGRVVLMDTGNIRFAFDIDYNGTPGNPDDDQDVPDSFRIIRDSTGVNIVGRDFCADLRLFTT